MKKNVVLLILVASLGYFVDIYDLLIFSIVRTQSLKDIGIEDEKIRTVGEYIINMQMAGLLLGGFIWGFIGDRFGRLKVLFGSILLYSIANIINGFVKDSNTYAWIRLIAGIGLSGELGAGITLVTESMPKEKRGYGTMVVAGIGVLGASFAFLISQAFTWRHAYLVGGGMGLLLLLMRVGLFESGMFHNLKAEQIAKGKFSMLLTNKKRFKKYVCCILIGTPLWFVVGILITQSPEMGKALGAVEPLSAGKGIMLTYIGICIGEIIAGFIAQKFRSRRLTMLFFYIFSLIVVFVFLGQNSITQAKFDWLALIMGISVGYWATFVTIASESFGTNLRATVTTTAPNIVRGALIPITFLFELFLHRYGIISSAYIMMCIVTGVSFIALYFLPETFHKDLDYFEN